MKLLSKVIALLNKHEENCRLYLIGHENGLEVVANTVGGNARLFLPLVCHFKGPWHIYNVPDLLRELKPRTTFEISETDNELYLEGDGPRYLLPATRGDLAQIPRLRTPEDVAWRIESQDLKRLLDRVLWAVGDDPWKPGYQALRFDTTGLVATNGACLALVLEKVPVAFTLTRPAALLLREALKLPLGAISFNVTSDACFVWSVWPDGELQLQLHLAQKTELPDWSRIQQMLSQIQGTKVLVNQKDLRYALETFRDMRIPYIRLEVNEVLNLVGYDTPYRDLHRITFPAHLTGKGQIRLQRRYLEAAIKDTKAPTLVFDDQRLLIDDRHVKYVIAGLYR